MRWWLGAVLIIIVFGLVFAGVLRRSQKTPPLANQTAPLKNFMPERVTLKTSDGFTIIGDYYLPDNPSSRGLLLLHMMPATRQSWQDFAKKASESGWQVLAIDLRGHGESQGGPDGYRAFSDAEHQASRLDVQAAADFLASKGAKELSLGGASIGANLALEYLASHPTAKAAFLLSPGLDYRGLRTEPLVGALHSGQTVYFVASRDDGYSADTVSVLFGQTPRSVFKEIKLFDTAGHGTTIFERQPQFRDEVLTWLLKVAENK